MLSKNLPHREDYLRKKRKRKIIKYSIIFALLLLILGTSSYIAHRPELRINGIYLEGGVLVEQSEVEIEVIYFLDGSYLWLFPKDNSFWYPRNKLKKHLADTFKRIDKININLENPNTIFIDITERKPVAIWVDKTDYPESVVTEYNYFMDINGTIFSHAPTFSGNAYLKYYGLVEGDPVGQQYIESTDFHNITNFVEQVKNTGVNPMYFTAKSKDEFSLVLFGGTEIYFDNKVPLELLAENFKALLKTPDLKVSKEGTILAEYIDLRFGNKLFYKLKSDL